MVEEEILLDEVLLVDADPGTDATLLGRERIARLSVCLRRLSEKTRVILLSYRVGGLTHQEVAQRHEPSISTVEKCVAKAILQVTSWTEGW